MILGWSCPVCGAAGRVPCDRCHAALTSAGPVPPIDGVDACVALLAYERVGRELVARVKYRNRRTGVAWLAGGMAELARQFPVDVVTWAPATPEHLRERGFDHGQLLATRVARAIGRPATRLLRRSRGAPLTGRSAGQRLAGPPLAPRAIDLGGAAVLVVDDVVTTGATLRTAAACLRRIGAGSVMAVAAAYTPAPAFREKVVTKR